MSKVETKKEQRKGRGSHPNSRANLRPSKPGMTNNPHGKPPGTRDRASIIRKWLEVPREIRADRNPSGEVVKGTVEDEVILALIAKAQSGDVSAIREILDSVHGKLKEPIEITTPTEAAKDALRAIVSETGLSEERAKQIVAGRFGISEDELASERVM